MKTETLSTSAGGSGVDFITIEGTDHEYYIYGDPTAPGAYDRLAGTYKLRFTPRYGGVVTLQINAKNYSSSYISRYDIKDTEGNPVLAQQSCNNQVDHKLNVEAGKTYVLTINADSTFGMYLYHIKFIFSLKIGSLTDVFTYTMGTS